MHILAIDIGGTKFSFAAFDRLHGALPRRDCCRMKMLAIDINLQVPLRFWRAGTTRFSLVVFDGAMALCPEKIATT